MIRFTLAVFIFLKLSTETQSFYLTNQTSMLNIEDGIAYSVDTQKATVYAYNNLTQELLILMGNRFSVIDTIIFNPNLLFDTYYASGQNKLSREPKNLHFYYDPNTGLPMLLFWDSGLGRVHSYDIHSKQINRLDTSYDMRGFFGHGAFVDNEKLDIYTMGGYGEFVHKKNFLKFSSAFKEWVEIETSGEIPSDALFGQLYFDEARNRYLFVQRVWDMKIIIHELLSDGYVWKLINNFEFNMDVRDAEIYSFPFSGNYSNIHPDWIAFHANFLFHLSENKLYRLNNPEISQEIYRTFSMHPINGTDSVIIVGEKNKLNKELGVYKASIDDIIDFAEPLSGFSRFNYSLYALSGFLLFTFGWLLLKKRNQPQDEPTIKFNSNRSAVTVRIKGKHVVFEESLDLKFWGIVLSLLDQHVNTISFAEFDSYLFDEQYQANQYTLKRNQLIYHINNRLGIQFVTSRKEIHDKRYKRIVLDFSVLK